MHNLTALFAAAVVAVIIIVVIIVVKKRSESGHTTKEGFLLNFSYTPACGSTWDGSRSPDCRGLTGGVMPSIETTNYSSCGLCCGYLGVPP